MRQAYLVSDLYVVVSRDTTVSPKARSSSSSTGASTASSLPETLSTSSWAEMTKVKFWTRTAIAALVLAPLPQYLVPHMKLCTSTSSWSEHAHAPFVRASWNTPVPMKSNLLDFSATLSVGVVPVLSASVS